MDVEFYLVERRLAERGLGRGSGESLLEWSGRMDASLPEDPHGGALTPIARLHYRYRFDPHGLAAGERERLRGQALAWLQAAEARMGALSEAAVSTPDWRRGS